MTETTERPPAGADPVVAPHATVHQALAAVIAAMPAVGKDQENKEQGYKFRGIDDVVAAARHLMGRAGVVVVPNVVERIYEARATRGGSTMHVVHLHVEYTVYGPAGDSLTASTWGEGTDMGDKATNKAMTAAFKYLLFQLLMVGGGEDGDRYTPPETVADWWTENWGEGGEATHNAEKAKLVHYLKQLPAEQQAAFKEWRTAPERQYQLQGTLLPEELAAMGGKVGELAAAAGIELQAPEEGPSKPPGPESDEPAPTGPEAPEPAQQPAEPPTDPATIPDAPPAGDMDAAIAFVQGLGKPAVVDMLRNNQLPTNGNEDTLRRRLVEYLVTAQPELAQADRTQEDVATGGKL